jgi:AcrR family transcriptional regulator
MARPRKFKRENVLIVATSLAASVGYQNITREDVAKSAFTSPGTVSGLFGSMEQLKQEVIKFSINNTCLPVIAQALAARNKLAMGISDDLKRRVAEAMIK